MSGYIASANRSDWETPRELFQALDAEFHFSLDVCANEKNHKCERYFTPEQDGLTQNWGACLLVQSPVWARNRRLGEEGGGEQRYHGDATPGENGHKMVSRSCIRQGGDSVPAWAGSIRWSGCVRAVSKHDCYFQKGGHLMAQRYRHYTPYRDPQAEEARIVTYCAECGEAICEGYDYYRIHTDDYCDACMRGFATVAEVEDEPFVMEDDDGGML